MANESDRAFSKNFVIAVTLKHMLPSIDFSIEKTLARVSEFEGDSRKSMEILQTLAALNSMRREIVEHAKALQTDTEVK